ncbi:MAG: hypothetical protein K2M75_05270 [Clostridia bacterium]|nr:hypothetical protein [Clostridia bacterium]
MADTAEKLYKKYVKITKSLVEICDIAKGIDGELSVQEYLVNFDLLLQSLLFYQCKCNRAIYPKELDFISELTEDDDILERVNAELEKHSHAIDDVKWDNLFDCDKDTFALIDGEIQTLAKEYTKQLVAYVALAECLDGKSHFDKLNDDIVDLLYYFAKLENGADENEVEQGIIGYVKFVANYYVEVVRNMESIFADKNIKKELLTSLRKEYREAKRANRFLERHLKAIKERLAGLLKKDKDSK